MASFNSVSFSNRLRKLDTSQPSIGALANYIQLNRQFSEEIGRAIARDFANLSDDAQLAAVYVVNELWQNSRKKCGDAFVDPLVRPVQACLAIMAARPSPFLAKAQRTVGVWAERAIVSKPIIALLQQTISDPAIVLEHSEDADVLVGPEMEAAAQAAALEANAAASAAAAAAGKLEHMPQASAELQRPPSPLGTLELEMRRAASEGTIPAIDSLLAADAHAGSGKESTASVPLAELLSRVQALAADVERTEVTSGLTRVDAASARGSSARAFVAEERAAMEGHAQDEVAAESMRASSTLADAVAAHGRVTAHMKAIEAETRSRVILLEMLGELLDRVAVQVGEGGTYSMGEGEEGAVDAAMASVAVDRARRVLSSVRGVKRRLMSIEEDCAREAKRRAVEASEAASRHAEARKRASEAQQIARAMIAAATSSAPAAYGGSGGGGGGDSIVPALPSGPAGGWGGPRLESFPQGSSFGQMGPPPAARRAPLLASYPPPLPVGRTYAPLPSSTYTSDDFGAIFNPGGAKGREVGHTTMVAHSTDPTRMRYAPGAAGAALAHGGPYAGGGGRGLPLPLPVHSSGVPGAPRPQRPAGRGLANTLPAWMTQGLQ